MGFWSNFLFDNRLDVKSDTNVTNYTIPDNSPAQVRLDIARDQGFGPIGPIQIAAVFACARVIAEGLAQVPCLLQRKSASGGHELATDHPLYTLLAITPNDYMTSFELREWIGFQLALIGNCYLYIGRDVQGRAIEIIPIVQSLVSIDTTTFGEVTYRLNIPGQPVYNQSNIWHLRGPSWDSFRGLSIQQTACSALGLAADLEAFGSQLFRNGASPSGLLSTDQSMSAEQQQQLALAWNSQNVGMENAHKTAILSNGLQFQKMQTDANEAQFIEARRYQTEEICRVMRVDPIMVQQSTNTAAYASIEQRFLAHLIHTLDPWFVRFEQSAASNLLTKAELRAGYRIKMDGSGLAKGSANDRAEYLATMKQNGFITTNEGRESEGYDRFDEESADLLTEAVNLYGPSTPAPDRAA